MRYGSLVFISSRVFKVITELLPVKKTPVTYVLFPERKLIKIILPLGRFVKKKTKLFKTIWFSVFSPILLEKSLSGNGGCQNVLGIGVPSGNKTIVNFCAL